jgi:integrase
MDKDAENDLARKLRAILGQFKNPISDGTKSDYLKKYAHILACKKLPDGIARTPGSYYAYRAAFLYGTAEEARQALRNRDRLPIGTPDRQAAIEKIQACISRFEMYPPDKKQQHQELGSSSFTWADVKKTLTQDGVNIKRHSKKYMLSALIKRGNWTEKILDLLPEQYKQIAAVMSLTGCRPSELGKGVKISQSEGNLYFCILGSKVTSKSGQDSRVIGIDMSSKAAQYLVDCMKGREQISIVLANAKSFAEALASAGKSAFPRLRGRVSPYIWRHALSSDMKSSGVLPEQVAAALGHRVTRTQEHYGRHAHGCGSVGLIAVHASTEIRDNRRDPRRLSPSPRAISPSLIF